MTEVTNSSVARGIHILESLFENDFQGKTETEISKNTGIPLSTVFRILKTYKSLNWVEDYPVEGSKTIVWKVCGTTLIKISNQYEESALRKIQAIKKDYLKNTGKELTK